MRGEVADAANDEEVFVGAVFDFRCLRGLTGSLCGKQ